MQGKKTIDRLEQSVEDTIETLADELKLTVHYYPHVVLVHKNTTLRSLKLPSKYAYSFRTAKSGQAIYDPPYIFFPSNNHINEVSEESTHFLHLTNSGRGHYVRRSFKDHFSFEVIGEAIGFFGSKIINPKRRSSFVKCEEKLPEDHEEIEEFLKDNFGRSSSISNDPLMDDLIHYEGYRLGEKLFFEYIKGRIPLRKVRFLFREELKDKGEAFKEFVKLKDRLS